MRFAKLCGDPLWSSCKLKLVSVLHFVLHPIPHVHFAQSTIRHICRHELTNNTIDILTSGTENRGKGNSAKGKEEQKPVTTVALDRVCVRV